MLILIAAEPVFSENQLARMIMTEGHKIWSAQQNLVEPFARLEAPGYRHMGGERDANTTAACCPVALESGRWTATRCCRCWQARHAGTGPTGLDKELFGTCCWLPRAKVTQTGEISRALNSNERSRPAPAVLDRRGAPPALIDSPASRNSGCAAYAPTDIAHARHRRAGGSPVLQRTHLHEPGCAVRAQVETDSPGTISASRYRIYGELFAGRTEATAR